MLTSFQTISSINYGRRESNETFWASNNGKYIANATVIDQDLKRDEDHSHKECSTYANSPNATAWKAMVFHRHVRIVFFSSQPIGLFKMPYC